jgi:hypothetical protein
MGRRRCVGPASHRAPCGEPSAGRPGEPSAPGAGDAGESGDLSHGHPVVPGSAAAVLLQCHSFDLGAAEEGAVRGTGLRGDPGWPASVDELAQVAGEALGDVNGLGLSDPVLQRDLLHDPIPHFTSSPLPSRRVASANDMATHR